MTAATVRTLLVADTHLGFDLPFHPRVLRRRRGYDFFANFQTALLPALRSEVDLVVHGGDLLFRSRVPPALVEMALAPLIRVAEGGVPVFLVPGNHERSRIPLQLPAPLLSGAEWAGHPNLYIFDRPRTFVCRVAGVSLALSGFPFAREVRDRFVHLVDQTRHDKTAADAHLLSVHQTVEGAQVGPSDYTFRGGPDVIRGRDIPAGFAAVLAGHIHRAQVLTHDLWGRPLAAPVVYPGSVERTAFAERNEDKGYALVRLDLSAGEPGARIESTFVSLPARPMVVLSLEPESRNRESLVARLRERLSALDPDAVVRIELCGPHAASTRDVLTAAYLRELAPPTMNVELTPDWISPRPPAPRVPAHG